MKLREEFHLVQKKKTVAGRYKLLRAKNLGTEHHKTNGENQDAQKTDTDIDHRRPQPEQACLGGAEVWHGPTVISLTSERGVLLPCDLLAVLTQPWAPLAVDDHFVEETSHNCARHHVTRHAHTADLG
jgi:hypothetical protein